MKQMSDTIFCFVTHKLDEVIVQYLYHNSVHEEDIYLDVVQKRICEASVDSDETQNTDEIQNQTMVSLHTASLPLY